MPRQPKPENVRHPLKLLRSLLSEDPSKPVPQARLAELIDMSANSIKMTEVGDREMSRPLKDKIDVVLGAAWSEERKRWEFSWSRGADAPVFTHELYCRHRELIGSLPDPRIKTDIENDIKRKIALLFERVPPDHWWLLVLRLWENLSAAVPAFFPERGGDFDKEFGTAELNMTVRFDPKTGHVVKMTAAPRSQWLERDNAGKLTKLQGFAWSGEQDSDSKTISQKEFESLPGQAFMATELTEQRYPSGKRRRPTKKKSSK